MVVFKREKKGPSITVGTRVDAGTYRTYNDFCVECTRFRSTSTQNYENSTQLCVFLSSHLRREIVKYRYLTRPGKTQNYLIRSRADIKEGAFCSFKTARTIREERL